MILRLEEVDPEGHWAREFEKVRANYILNMKGDWAEWDNMKRKMADMQAIMETLAKQLSNLVTPPGAATSPSLVVPTLANLEPTASPVDTIELLAGSVGTTPGKRTGTPGNLTAPPVAFTSNTLNQQTTRNVTGMQPTLDLQNSEVKPRVIVTALSELVGTFDGKSANYESWAQQLNN